MEFCTNQWTGLFMIGTSIMKELTTVTNFTESEVSQQMVGKATLAN